MTATAARSSPKTSSFCDHQEGGASVPPFHSSLVARARLWSAGRIIAGRINPGTAVTTAAAQVPGYHVQFEGDRPGEALIAQPGRRHDDYTPAAAALDLRIEAMTNEIGDRIEAFGSHTHREHINNFIVKGCRRGGWRLSAYGRHRALFRRAAANTQASPVCWVCDRRHQVPAGPRPVRVTITGARGRALPCSRSGLVSRAG